MTLEVQNLKVAIEDKTILQDFNLTLEKGKIHALMGPNGSGKSTLANALMGNPKYKIISGKIMWNGENITNLATNERAKKGFFLSFQYPQELEGITIAHFLRQAYNAVNDKMPILTFKKYVKALAKKLDAPEEFTSRYLNHGFSGGEKKKSEILQLLTLNPSLAILDETDSGLDVDALKIIAKGIKEFMTPDKTVLVITHYKRILEHLDPDQVIIVKNGEVIKKGGKELAHKIEEEGYKEILKN